MYTGHATPARMFFEIDSRSIARATAVRTFFARSMLVMPAGGFPHFSLNGFPIHWIGLMYTGLFAVPTSSPVAALVVSHRLPEKMIDVVETSPVDFWATPAARSCGISLSPTSE